MNISDQTSKLAAMTACIFAAGALCADTFSATDALSVGVMIDDPPIPGTARMLAITTQVNQITDLSITLDIGSADGDTAWNGDIYAQLTSPSGTLSVLLNQPGVTAINLAGYGDTGFVITVLDSAGSDIHSYQEVSYNLNGRGQLTGTWQSDGRADPTSAIRDKPLSRLLGENPNGIWTLFVSDLGNGNRAKLNFWSINGYGTAVPESPFTAVAASIAMGVFSCWRRATRCP